MSRLSSILSPVTLALRVILSWLKMPDIRFHRFQNLTPEEHLVWWHVPVSLKHGWLKVFPLDNLTSTLIIERPMKKALAMCWRSDYSNVPRYRSTLTGNEVLYIPIAARTTLDRCAPAYTEPTLVDDNLAKDWILRRGVTRITDENHFFIFTDLTDLPSPKDYRVTLEVRAGKTILAYKHYVLHVPDVGAKNRLFTLEEI